MYAKIRNQFYTFIGVLNLHHITLQFEAKTFYAGPDYGIGIVGKCLRPTTSKVPAKDGWKIH